MKTVLYNIVILSSDPSPEYIGGIKRVTSILAKEWSKKGNNVFYLTACNNEKRKDKKYRIFDTIDQIFFEDYSDYSSPENINLIKEKIEINRPIIVLNPHVEDKQLSEFSIKLKDILDAKLIQALHFHPNFDEDIIKYNFFSNYTYKNYNLLKQFFIDILLWIRYYGKKRSLEFNKESDYLTQLYDSSDSFIALSDLFIPILKNKIKTDDYKKLRAINNPASLSISTTVNPSSKKNIILWVGRMDMFCKRIDIMLKIWKYLSKEVFDWKLKIIGSGNKGNIQRIINKKGLKNIEVLGFQDPEPFYEEASIVCSTSVSEGWGMTLIEGMAHRCIPVAFDNEGSINDIIKNGLNGYIIPRGNNSKAYSDILRDLIRDKVKRDILALNAQETVKNFNPEDIANKWISLFN